MAEQLTIQQAQAANDRGGRLLVSAAAGSGKTKVLVDRLLSYLTQPEDPANIDDFLIITYTKAAACMYAFVDDCLNWKPYQGSGVARFIVSIW